MQASYRPAGLMFGPRSGETLPNVARAVAAVEYSSGAYFHTKISKYMRFVRFASTQILLNLKIVASSIKIEAPHIAIARLQEEYGHYFKARAKESLLSLYET